MTTETCHCQVCGRAIRAGNGRIAHHGYTRPGHGWQTRSCMGARHVPYEVGHDALDQWIDFLNRYIPETEERLADHLANPPAEMIYRRRGYGGTRYPEQTLARPDGFTSETGDNYRPGTYANEYHGRVRALRRELVEMRETLDYATARREAWVAPASN